MNVHFGPQFSQGRQSAPDQHKAECLRHGMSAVGRTQPNRSDDSNGSFPVQFAPELPARCRPAPAMPQCARCGRSDDRHPLSEAVVRGGRGRWLGRWKADRPLLAYQLKNRTRKPVDLNHRLKRLRPGRPWGRSASTKYPPPPGSSPLDGRRMPGQWHHRDLHERKQRQR
jgi:hypothetical protein